MKYAARRPALFANAKNTNGPALKRKGVDLMNHLQENEENNEDEGTDEKRGRLEELKKVIAESNYIVFFGGAGVSTESGIPDFRSVDGLYNQKYDYPPEEILSHTFFMRHTDEFYRFYRDKLMIHGVQPNKAHRALAKLEAMGKLKAVVTQNIDGLHQEAGSHAVYELHGSIMRNYCMKCGKFYSLSQIEKKEAVPHCDVCGEIIKPDVVLYEEGLDNQILNDSVAHIAQADTLIIGGTSLAVYPAAGLVRYFRGKNLVLINKSVTPMDKEANYVFHDSIGKVLEYCTE